jgi:hypothetical protein
MMLVSICLGRFNRCFILITLGFAVRGGDGGTPPPFMPGNAGFLYAVAYMVAGWEGSEEDTPGFPKDGSWSILHEGLHKAP